MDPIYLEGSELEYELTIRQIKNANTPREKTAILRDIFKRETNNEIESPPHSAPYYNADEEIQTCSYTLRELMSIIEEVNLFKDHSKLDRVSSRLLHIRLRISRIVPMTTRDEDDIEDLYTSTVKGITSVHELRARAETGTKTRRSRVNIADQQSQGSVNRLVDSQDPINRVGSSLRRIERSSGAEMKIPSQQRLTVEAHETNIVQSQDQHINRPLTPLLFSESLAVPTNESLFDFENLSLLERSAIEEEINNELQPHIQKLSSRNLNAPRTIVNVAGLPPYPTTEPETINRTVTAFRADNERHYRNNNVLQIATNNVERREIPNRYAHSLNLPTNWRNVINEPVDQRSRQVRYEEDHMHRAGSTRPNIHRDPLVDQGRFRDDFPCRRQPNERESFVEPQLRYQRPFMRENRYVRPEEAFGEPIYDRYQRSNRKPIPVNQWRITYNGDGKDPHLYSFLNQVDMYQQAEQLSDNELLRSAVHLFGGRAKLWYQSIYDMVDTWEDLVRALKEEFLPGNYEYKMFNDISNRRQKPNESFGEFITHMKSLFRCSSVPISEQHQLFIVQQNLLPRYAIAVAPLCLRSLAQLTEACRRIDDAAMQNRQLFNLPFEQYPNPTPRFNPFNRPRQVSEVQNNNAQANANERISLISHRPFRGNSNTNGTPRLVRKCWNCDQEGHSFNVCIEPRNRLFCFKCGFNGVISRECQQCSGNASRDLVNNVDQQASRPANQ